MFCDFVTDDDIYSEQQSLVLCGVTPPSAVPPVARKNAADPRCITPPLALLQANLSRPCSTFIR